MYGASRTPRVSPLDVPSRHVRSGDAATPSHEQGFGGVYVSIEYRDLIVVYQLTPH